MSTLDFFEPIVGKKGIEPDFMYTTVDGGPIQDLIIRGKTFFAIWDEEKGLWSTSEARAVMIIDNALELYGQGKNMPILTLRRSSTGMMKRFHDFCSNAPDNYVDFDTQIVYKSTPVTKDMHVSRRLNYDPVYEPCPAWVELLSRLYNPTEAAKIEWSMGVIFSNSVLDVQKFLVLYGEPGSGKSTILNIIADMLPGYTAEFDAASLGNQNAAFALAPFADNPIVAMQHDGDLSKIETNVRLNSVVSHERILMNMKFVKEYPFRPIAYLMIGTNEPVKLSSADSGLTRRLLDCSPKGRTPIPYDEYMALMDEIENEYGAIASRCIKFYNDNKKLYKNYKPTGMFNDTNQFYAFISEHKQDWASGVSEQVAWLAYKDYITDANLSWSYNKQQFVTQLRRYFESYSDDTRVGDVRVYKYYSKMKDEMFSNNVGEVANRDWLNLQQCASAFDVVAREYPAQLANADGFPTCKWENNTTQLKDIDTRELHFVKVPENHIVLDFDIKGPDGKKSLEKNLEAARLWPETYAEVSKSGCGIHLHYIYNGDPSNLAPLYGENVEIKVFKGNSSLRRQLSLCTPCGISTISNLPERVVKTLDSNVIKNERHLEKCIQKALRREIGSGNTTPSVTYISACLDQAYNAGWYYDMSKYKDPVYLFAAKSHNQAPYCLKVWSEMKWHSEATAEPLEWDHDTIGFYDIEVFPNFWCICFLPMPEIILKMQEEGTSDQDIVKWLAYQDRPGHWPNFEKIKSMVHIWINPNADQVGELVKYKLIGFNNLRYDNGIVWEALLGANNEELYMHSQNYINDKEHVPYESKQVSFTDIYDFSSKKQSLKKFEIEMDIPHQECFHPWDQPLAPKDWDEVTDYCANDVVATLATFLYRSDDYAARLILAQVANGTPNDTTNSLTTKIIFGDNRNPQNEFCYRDMSDPAQARPEFPAAVFPGYRYEYGKSTYRGSEIGEGGRVYANPGVYGRTICFDVASMHPHSITAENLFGDRYTQRFKEIMDARVAAKHFDVEAAKDLLGGALVPYMTDKKASKKLAQALKIAINSVYGLTAAKFKNPFKDDRNVDNIVAKRGALFMEDLRWAVEEKGYTVVHIKTDSIKIANPDDYICNFVVDFGHKYGYDFEVEHVFEKIALVNDAVYIGKLAEDDPEAPGEWEATGKMFAVPYTYKSLFSHEEIIFDDMCVTNSVTSALYLDMNYELVKQMIEKYPAYNKSGTCTYGLSSTDVKLYDKVQKLYPMADLSEYHDYHFIGKIGKFVPIKPGCGGGILLRQNGTKFANATGASGYYWIDADRVDPENYISVVDTSYHMNEVNKAVDAIYAVAGDQDISWFFD